MSSWRVIGEGLDMALACLYAADRSLKMAAVHRFFKEKRAGTSVTRPSVSLIQPITRGASALNENLAARLNFEYPGSIEFLFVIDRMDTECRDICREIVERAPGVNARILEVTSVSGAASKVAKMRAGIHSG